MSRRVSRLLVAAMALVLLAGGCGESEKEKYRREVKAINERFAREQQQIKATALPEAATQVKRLQSVINRWAQRLAEVKPPSKVKDLHARLTMLIRAYGRSLSPAIEAADAGDLDRFRKSATALQRSQNAFVSQVSTLSAEYTSRGYKLS